MKTNLERLHELNVFLESSQHDELLQTEKLLEAILRNENRTYSIASSANLLAVSCEVLQHSSRLLKNGSIGESLHAIIEQYVVDSMRTELLRFPHRGSDGSTAFPSLDFKGLVFTQPLTFPSIHFQHLCFNDCAFRSALHLTGTTSENTIEFSNCSFAQEHEFLVRMTSFPKPEPPSSWRPSMSFKNCSIQYLHVFRAELFLFFTDSTIGGMSLELSPGSTVQYVNCQVTDGIVHAIDEQRTSNGYSGHQLVPKDWYKNRGWTLN